MRTLISYSDFSTLPQSILLGRKRGRRRWGGGLYRATGMRQNLPSLSRFQPKEDCTHPTSTYCVEQWAGWDLGMACPAPGPEENQRGVAPQGQHLSRPGPRPPGAFPPLCGFLLHPSPSQREYSPLFPQGRPLIRDDPGSGVPQLGRSTVLGNLGASSTENLCLPAQAASPAQGEAEASGMAGLPRPVASI